jgi:hypothetical protein
VHHLDRRVHVTPPFFRYITVMQELKDDEPEWPALDEIFNLQLNGP